MAGFQLRRELWVPRPLPVVFDFFAHPENLERITPPWLRFRILAPPPGRMQEGTTMAYALRVRGIPLRWVAEIQQWDPPHGFVDVQVSGPYKSWRHSHQFSEVEGGTSVVDLVQYALPFGPLGMVVHRVRVARDLRDIFDYRARRVRELLA